MSETNGTAEGAPRPDAEPMAAHGGRAGWFRVACGFSALATIEMSYHALSITQASDAATANYSPFLAAPLAAGAICFAWASVLAIRHRRRSGLFLGLGYLVPAVTMYAVQGTVVPPSLLFIASMLALILATRKNSGV